MPQTITTGFRALIDAAEREIDTLAVEGCDRAVWARRRDLHRRPRYPRTRARRPPARRLPLSDRGMLEFWIDPQSPYHKPIFGDDPRFVFFCAGGWRSALTATGDAPDEPTSGIAPSKAASAHGGAKRADPWKSPRSKSNLINLRLAQNPRKAFAGHWPLRLHDVRLERSGNPANRPRAPGAPATPAFADFGSNAPGRRWPQNLRPGRETVTLPAAAPWRRWVRALACSAFSSTCACGRRCRGCPATLRRGPAGDIGR